MTKLLRLACLGVRGIVGWAVWLLTNMLSPRKFLLFLAPVAEHPRIGSDGESEEASAASDDLTSPARVRPPLDVSYGVTLRQKSSRRHSEASHLKFMDNL